MKKRTRLFVICVLVINCLVANAQDFKKSDIEPVYRESGFPGRIIVTAMKNNYNEEVVFILKNEYTGNTYSRNVKSHEYKDINEFTCNHIQAHPVSSDKFIDIFYRPMPKEQDAAKPQEVKSEEVKKQKSNQVVIQPKQPTASVLKPVWNTNNITTKKNPLTTDEVVNDFCNDLESIPFFSLSAIEEETSAIDEHLNKLRNWKDKDAYISDNSLKSYLNAITDSLDYYSKHTAILITSYLDKYEKEEIADKAECIESIQAVIADRLRMREANISRLSEELNVDAVTESSDWKSLDWKTIGICTGLLVLLVILFVWFRKVSKAKRTTSLTNKDSSGTVDASSAIVVRRKTTAILKKQSLEDVIDNDNYMEIDCKDFCENSAVRRMYIKNTCIKDIYDMYAEDLRNPNKPNEDGCMVLGRWVHDEDSNDYYVSLEHIVLPGDDAVFSEYELNFGGKIKLKVTEKLRKLRRDTNLQYDLTCWVHSHPGLGVFFSNSDSNVQMQLKHPTHPNFLTAIVVDILTPEQEMGIFTFKRDSSISSKADLKKMYSLEELHKWAVESDRNSFKPEDHYNSLADAKSHFNDCYGIELSNGAIIDIGKLTEGPTSGLVGMVHGFCNQRGLRTEPVCVTVSKNEAVPDNELIGCFVIATHCSIPSIRKAIASYVNRIKFVLVYTTTDGLLTSIPVANQDVCMDENYYGEQKLEDLKIWTRRRR